MTTPRKTQTTTTTARSRSSAKPARSRAPRVVPTPAPAEPAAPAAAPQAYVIPTPLLVDAIKLLGTLPIQNEVAQNLYQQIRRLPTLDSVLEQLADEEEVDAASG